MSHDIYEVCLKLSERIYKDFEKIAYMRGASIERVILDVSKHYLSIVRDIDVYYRFKYEMAVEETRKLLESALARGIIKKIEKIKPENIALNLGKLITVIRDAYGDIPREFALDNIKEDEWKKLEEMIVKIEGRRNLDPRKYILNRVKEIRGVAPAFGIEVLEDKGSLKALRFNNVNLLAMYYGYGTRFLRRRLR